MDSMQILKILGILGLGLILVALLFAVFDLQYTTRICQNGVCNDYEGYLDAKANGCTAIPIVNNPNSEVCGSYTLEHIRK